MDTFLQDLRFGLRSLSKWQGTRMALAGVIVGIAGALALTRIMASLLYEVRPTDVPTFAIVALVVLC